MELTVKCTGGHPCERCRYKHLTCVFAVLVPKKAPATTHSRLSSGPKATTTQPKKRRTSSNDHVRYSSTPIKPTMVHPPPVQSVESVEKQNYLQLQLDNKVNNGAQPQRNYWAPSHWALYSQPVWTDDIPLDDAGLAALGFSSQQPYAPPGEHDAVPSFGPVATYVNGRYIYSDAPVTSSAVGSSRTPSISNNSSPSYGEVPLQSPHDFNMIGKASSDGYFAANHAERPSV